MCDYMSEREFLSCLCPGPDGPSWRWKGVCEGGAAGGGIRHANIPVSLGSSPGVQMNYADPVQTECVEVLVCVYM